MSDDLWDGPGFTGMFTGIDIVTSRFAPPGQVFIFNPVDFLKLKEERFEEQLHDSLFACWPEPPDHDGKELWRRAHRSLSRKMGSRR